MNLRIVAFLLAIAFASVAFTVLGMVFGLGQVDEITAQISVQPTPTNTPIQPTPTFTPTPIPPTPTFTPTPVPPTPTFTPTPVPPTPTPTPVPPLPAPTSTPVFETLLTRGKGHLDSIDFDFKVIITKSKLVKGDFFAQNPGVWSIEGPVLCASIDGNMAVIGGATFTALVSDNPDGITIGSSPNCDTSGFGAPIPITQGNITVVDLP